MTSFASQARNRQVSEDASQGKPGVLTYHKVLVEEYLEGLVFSAEPRLAGLVEAMRYSYLAGGMRLRPVLCMETARGFGRDPVEVLPSAAAIELIHTLALVHKDLPPVKGADVRYGRTATHREFGEATAILAGDAFFGEALALITLRQKGTEELVLEVVRVLATSTGAAGMVGGQSLEVSHDGRAMDAETLFAVYGYETGALIGASARAGAILAGASPREQEAVSNYAFQLGLCLRIVDDILEATGGRERHEVRNGKASFVEVHGLAGARRLANQSMDESLGSLEKVAADTEELAKLTRFFRYREDWSRS